MNRRDNRLRVDDGCGPLKPGAYQLLLHAGCFVYKLHHAPRNVSFEECLPRQIAGGGGVLAVQTMN